MIAKWKAGEKAAAQRSLREAFSRSLLDLRGKSKWKVEERQKIQVFFQLAERKKKIYPSRK
jgi:hypothetical protein